MPTSSHSVEKHFTPMKPIIYLVALLAWSVTAARSWAEETPVKKATKDAVAAQDKFFQDQVLPILTERCWECHGEGVQESGLRLDSRHDLMAGGDSGTKMAVVGKPAESYLLRVLQHDGDVDMPPDEKLPAAEIDVLRRWVASGLPWPTDSTQPRPLTKEEKLAQQLEQHWSFQQITAPKMPSVKGKSWVAQPLDQFVLAHLEHDGLVPSPQADRYTLIRRLKFDLLGLPPTAVEVSAFVSDTSKDAYEKLVDRYLASPHYGERWGRHWLDVARYADTKGYAFARDRRYLFAYTYRDYVIRSFNEDVPFDQFVPHVAAEREQSINGGE